MGEMLASVAGGLGQGLVQAQELGMKRDYYAALKKQADADIKAAEAKAQMQLQRNDMLTKFLGLGGKPPSMPMAGSGQQQPGVVDIPVGRGPLPDVLDGNPAYAGILDAYNKVDAAGPPPQQGIPQQLAQAQIQEVTGGPMGQLYTPEGQIAFREIMGYDPPSGVGKIHFEKVEDATQIQLIPFDSFGRQVGPARPFPKPIKTEYCEREKNGGGKERVPFTPSFSGGGGMGQPPRLGATPGIEQPVMVEQPKGVPQADAGKMQMAQTGLQALNEFTNIIYDEKGQIKRWPLINKLIGEGRRVESLIFSVIDPIVRAATGAGMPNDEMARYLKAYTPNAMDDQATIESKMRRMESFLNGFLEKLDPTGNLRARIGPGGQAKQPAPKQPSTLPPEALGHLREKIPAQFKIDGEIQTWVLENGQPKRIK